MQDRCDALFVGWIGVTVEQTDGDCRHLVCVEDGDKRRDLCVIKRGDDLLVVGRSFIDDEAALDRDQWVWPRLIHVVERGTVTTAYFEYVGKSTRGNQGGHRAAPFQQCIGGDGRPMDEDIGCITACNLFDEGNCRVGRRAQSFCNMQGACLDGHKIRKRPAGIDSHAHRDPPHADSAPCIIVRRNTLR